MAGPNIPIVVPFENHGQEDGYRDSGLIENKKQQGFSQTHRGRGRKEAIVPGQTEPPQTAIRYDETQEML